MDEKKVRKKVGTTQYDIQRMRLERLMKNPEKPAYIPERSKEEKSIHVPDFVRNVMGSSAGAGSGEFHVYRHLRRKEYSRQKQIAELSEKEKLDIAYQEKLIENKRASEERTAKNRAKRLKKKMKRKENLIKKKTTNHTTHTADLNNGIGECENSNRNSDNDDISDDENVSNMNENHDSYPDNNSDDPIVPSTTAIATVTINTSNNPVDMNHNNSDEIHIN